MSSGGGGVVSANGVAKPDADDTATDDKTPTKPLTKTPSKSPSKSPSKTPTKTPTKTPPTTPDDCTPPAADATPKKQTPAGQGFTAIIRGSDPRVATCRGKLQSKRSKLNQEINKELRLRAGAGARVPAGEAGAAGARAALAGRQPGPGAGGRAGGCLSLAASAF
ncbi:Uncharacterized protein GBIM_04601 [Gryllus bimaculatus]|nr:Uncharacterized protein GBIM_04601 [Gryllus bimaculatus]